MTIYIPKNASAVERNAAEELALYLGKACGMDFPVLSCKYRMPSTMCTAN